MATSQGQDIGPDAKPELKFSSRNRFSQKKHSGRQTVSFDSFTSSASTSASVSENSSIDLGISLPSKKAMTSFKVLSRSLTGTYFGKPIGPKPSTAPAGYENISMTQQRSKSRVNLVNSVKIHKSPVRAQSLANQYSTLNENEPCISDHIPAIPKRSKSASVDYGRSSKNASRYKVLEFLHCGTVENSLDVPWLCSNKIAILINLNNVEKVKTRIVCNCGNSKNSKFHSPKEISTKLDSKDSPHSMVKKFHVINGMIAEARSKGTQVLLFDNDGFTCQMVSIQYIMQYFEISLNSAMAHLERHTRLRLPENFLIALRLWEKTVLEPDSAEKAMAKRKDDKQPRKIAWS